MKKRGVCAMTVPSPAREDACPTTRAGLKIEDGGSRMVNIDFILILLIWLILSCLVYQAFLHSAVIREECGVRCGAGATRD